MDVVFRSNLIQPKAARRYNDGRQASLNLEINLIADYDT
jgi:hypothetical protein